MRELSTVLNFPAQKSKAFTRIQDRLVEYEVFVVSTTGAGGVVVGCFSKTPL
jgi:hypothetical protein